jgi:HlyD family secretion protein
MERNLRSTVETASSGQRGLPRVMPSATATCNRGTRTLSEKLAGRHRRSCPTRESLNKAQLRKQLVELRAERDAIVLTVAKLSVGSVLQSGQQFITLVPTDAPLEVEANILGRDDGFIRLGDPVSVKFDTFPFIQYGLAYGTVRTISADSFTSQDEQRNRRVRCRSTAPGRAQAHPIDQWTYALLQISVSPGMPVTADIKVGKRRSAYLLGRALIASEGMREP